MGIEVDPPVVNWSKMLSYKESMIKDNTKGIEYLFKKNKITLINGWASFIDQNTISVDNKNFEANYFVIATGSEASSLKNIEFDEQMIVSSTGALELKKIPKKMIIVGAGVIGLEMGSVWSRLGAEVEVVEFLDHITPGMDREISSEFMKILKKQGIKFKLNTKVEKITKNENGVILEVIDKENKKKNIEADVVLISVGRRPYTTGLKLENVGVKTDEKER